MGLRLVICHAAIWHSYCASVVWVYHTALCKSNQCRTCRTMYDRQCQSRQGSTCRSKYWQGLEHLCSERKLCLDTSEMHSS